MLIKAVVVFLGLMVLIAMVGRALFPTAANRVLRAVRPPAARCDQCGRYLIGRKDCGCKTKV